MKLEIEKDNLKDHLEKEKENLKIKQEQLEEVTIAYVKASEANARSNVTELPKMEKKAAPKKPEKEKKDAPKKPKKEKEGLLNTEVEESNVIKFITGESKIPKDK